MGNLPFFLIHRVNVAGWIHEQAVSLRPGKPAEKEMPEVDEVPDAEELRSDRSH
jgi:hypothetical protein